MTQKPNKQLFNEPFLPITILLVLLAGFFICANKFNSQLFLLIGVLQVISLIILFWFRSYLEKELTSIKIKREEYLEKINLLNLDIEKENLTKQSLFERIAAYAKLKNLAESLSLAATCSEAAGIIAGKTDELLGSQDATTILYLFDPKTGEFGLVSAVKSGTKVRVLLKTGDSFDRWVIKNLKPLLVEDAKSDFRFDEGKNILNDNERIKRSLISTPLIVGDKVLGILRIDSINENRFSAEDLRFLSRIGDLGAVAIESAQLYEHVQDLAIKDSLTGLYLRRHLLERMTEELPRQLKRKEELSFLMMDLDYFKDYNDRFGHVAGDIVLKTVSEILTRNFKEPGNIICRYGGEEFAVMLPGCSKEKACELAEKFRQEIESVEIILRREKTKITISIGVASFPSQAQMKEELIQKADEALYRAKGKGKNQVCLS